MSKIIGNELSEEVVELFNKELTTVILSTVTDEGFPHAMPVHLMAAPNNKTIKLALMKMHKTTANIKHNARAFISVIESTDIAISIKGSARVVKEPMEGNSAMSIVEFIVEEVKSDTTPKVIVTEGIRSKHRTDKTKDFFRVMFDELYKG
ncbi:MULTISPECIES: pyridoxamine 5'-phosphate oxidase family protein [unclassified Clostridium]|uniref:pyridoxamine 5'-phosphate oxidase family protein n=1 Tax=unclassified Clostridium TaxID=2614128 RepID=UPI0002986B48|nr:MULTISPECIES: pyridoxamine 5'-phosphate oxidase family protein [unclassified Clostridium]EKQ54383.1 MAG: Pyridoxamine 5''-phosphate oxidase [Clostridium sp. Maddingley MBC34-26]